MTDSEMKKLALEAIDFTLTQGYIKMTGETLTLIGSYIQTVVKEPLRLLAVLGFAYDQFVKLTTKLTEVEEIALFEMLDKSGKEAYLRIKTLIERATH